MIFDWENDILLIIEINNYDLIEELWGYTSFKGYFFTI